MVNKIWYFLLVYMSVCTDVSCVLQSCKDQTVSYVDVCDNKSLNGSTVYLSSTFYENNGLHGNDLKCGCTVQSTGQHNETITMGISPINEHPYGCQYQLDVTHKNRTVEYSCGIYGNDSFNIVPRDVIYMELVPGERPYGNAGFAFCLKISTTQGSGVTIACNGTITTDRPTGDHYTRYRPIKESGRDSWVTILVIIILIALVWVFIEMKSNNREGETVIFTNTGHLQSPTDAVQVQPELELNNITNTSHLQTSHTDAVQQYEQFQPEYAELNNTGHLQIMNINNKILNIHKSQVTKEF